MLPSHYRVLAEAWLALQIAKLGLLPLLSLVFYKNFTISDTTGRCMFCPPGNRAWVSAVEVRGYTLSAADLQQCIPNIECLECHPADFSLP